MGLSTCVVYKNGEKAAALDKEMIESLGIEAVKAALDGIL